MSRGAEHQPVPAQTAAAEGPAQLRFEEYKFFAESTQHLSERRQAATQIFLAINTALFAAVAFLLKEMRFGGWLLVAISIPLFLAGILISLIWQRTIEQYRILIGWRFDRLIEMEREIPGSFRMYSREEAFLFPEGPEGRRRRHRFGQSRLELLLPRLFLTAYVVGGLGLAVAAYLGLSVVPAGTL